jgi:hypothetical protein
MRIQYFPETDTLSIRLNDTLGIESEEIAPDAGPFHSQGGLKMLEFQANPYRFFRAYASSPTIFCCSFAGSP